MNRSISFILTFAICLLAGNPYLYSQSDNTPAEYDYEAELNLYDLDKSGLISEPDTKQTNLVKLSLESGDLFNLNIKLDIPNSKSVMYFSDIELGNKLIYIPNSSTPEISLSYKDDIINGKDIFYVSKPFKAFGGQMARTIELDYKKFASFLTTRRISIEELTIHIAFTNSIEYGLKENSLPALNSSLVSSLPKGSLSSLSKKNIDFKNSASAPVTISQGNALQLNINETGIYRLTAQQIQNAGLQVDNGRLDKLVLLGSGGADLPREVDIDYINSLSRIPLTINSSGGQLTDIVFYANNGRGFKKEGNSYEHFINTYEKNVKYVLAYADNPVAPILPKAAATGEVVNRPDSYIHRQFHEEDIVNLYDFGGGRDFLGEVLNQSKVYTDEVHNIVPGSEIEYYFSLAHRSGSKGSFDIQMNGEDYPIPFTLNNTSNTYISYSRKLRSHNLPASTINGNTSSIMFEYQPTSISGIGYLDYYIFQYERSLRAINNSITLFADPDMVGITEFNIDGFEENNPKYVYDITDPNNPIQLTDVSNTANRVVIRDDLNSSEKIYYASCDIKTPGTQSIQLAGLSAKDYTGVDMILVTHPELMESAQAFADYRSNNSGLNIEIVNILDIYKEFGGGNKDILAVRNFLSYHFNHLEDPFQYVFFWGHGHYDFRNINFAEKNLVPTYQSNEKDTTVISEENNYSTDDILIALGEESNGGRLYPSVATGRMPIKNNSDGFKYLQKLSDYENNSDSGRWRHSILLTADDGFTQSGSGNEGDMHSGASEGIANEILPNSLYQTKIYLSEFEELIGGGRRRGRKGARQALLDYFTNESAAIVNWTGHGNPGVWAHENFFVVDADLPQLDNYDKLPYIIAATCDFSRFDHPTNVSGGEKFVIKEDGGSIGMFAATRLVFVSSNEYLSRRLYAAQTRLRENGEYPTVGMAAMEAKYSNGAGSDANDWKYLLFADPSMRLIIPTNSASLTELNGNAISETQEVFELKGMQKIDIKGQLKDAFGNPMNDFDGQMSVIIHDGDRELIYTDFDSEEYNMVEYGGALNKINLPVSGGSFKGSFFLPKDISYSENHGRIFFYAKENEGNRTAKGTFTDFVINGLANVSSVVDNAGPEIELYMDHPDFESCDEVASTTTLYAELRDQSGINATGVGIGHNLEAWIGTSPDKIDLSGNYTTSLDEFGLGTTYTTLEDLEPGQYTITVRAWDIFNNFSVASTCFTVEEDADRQALRNTYPYPNPFDEASNIKIRHSLPTPFDVRVRISDIAGNQVDNFISTVTDGFYGEVSWNPTDRGLNLNTGTYYYTVESINTSITNPDDNNIVYGKMLYIKP
jgi:hypothetical protein